MLRTRAAFDSADKSDLILRVTFEISDKSDLTQYCRQERLLMSLTRMI